MSLPGSMEPLGHSDVEPGRTDAAAPAAVGERVVRPGSDGALLRRRPLEPDVHDLYASTNMPWITKDYLHTKHFREPAAATCWRLLVRHLLGRGFVYLDVTPNLLPATSEDGLVLLIRSRFAPPPYWSAPSRGSYLVRGMVPPFPTSNFAGSV
jgi:hypothetical protein